MTSTAYDIAGFLTLAFLWACIIASIVCVLIWARNELAECGRELDKTDDR